MKLKVALGKDVYAYTEIDIEVPGRAPTAVIVEAVMDALEDAIFEEDWCTSNSLRIVTARDEKGRYLLQDYPLDEVPFDAGIALGAWLSGRNADGGLTAVVNAAAQAKLIDSPVMKAHQGTLTLGGETINVKFACRIGATREEMDLAFFASMAQVAYVDYGAIGEGVDHE